jgi:ssDNA-binding replication factor A large subunit
VDIVAVVIELTQKEQIKLKDGTNKSKISMLVADDSGAKMVATFWGDSHCDKLNVKEKDIVVLKGMKISDYGGKSLNACAGT